MAAVLVTVIILVQTEVRVVDRVVEAVMEMLGMGVIVIVKGLFLPFHPTQEVLAVLET